MSSLSTDTMLTTIAPPSPGAIPNDKTGLLVNNFYLGKNSSIVKTTILAFLCFSSLTSLAALLGGTIRAFTAKTSDETAIGSYVFIGGVIGLAVNASLGVIFARYRD